MIALIIYGTINVFLCGWYLWVSQYDGYKERILKTIAIFFVGVFIFLVDYYGTSVCSFFKNLKGNTVTNEKTIAK